MVAETEAHLKNNIDLLRQDTVGAVKQQAESTGGLRVLCKNSSVRLFGRTGCFLFLMGMDVLRIDDVFLELHMQRLVGEHNLKAQKVAG